MSIDHEGLYKQKKQHMNNHVQAQVKVLSKRNKNWLDAGLMAIVVLLLGIMTYAYYSHSKPTQEVSLVSTVRPVVAESTKKAANLLAARKTEESQHSV